MSALSSAVHNAGHYHLQPRPVCLSPSCVRSANNEHSHRGSRILASVERYHEPDAVNDDQRYLVFYRVSATVVGRNAQEVFMAQAVLSAWWLHRFRYGPAEWLWRSLTYLRPLPMRGGADLNGPPRGGDDLLPRDRHGH